MFIDLPCLALPCSSIDGVEFSVKMKMIVVVTSFQVA